MTERTSRMVACAVVAVDPDQTATIEELARVLRGTLERSWRNPRPGRVIGDIWFGTDAAARAGVQALRGEGYAAVLGPPDAAHRVGWERRNAPVRIDDRLTVCFPWCPSERVDGTWVEIDPGLGFGTGDHPSTRLLLELLSGRLVGGETVLDVGCGSGVLAVAAAALGAAAAKGIDVNVEGLAAAEANAARNGVGSAIEFSATRLDHVEGAFDVVVANIHAPILIEMAPRLTERLGPDGWLALSGVSPGQLSRLTAAFPDIEFETPRRHEEWAALVGRAR